MSRTSFGAAVEALVAVITVAMPSDLEVSIGPPQPLANGAGIDVSLLSVTPHTPEYDPEGIRLPGELVVVLGVRADGIESFDLLHDLWQAVDQSVFNFSGSLMDHEWWAGFGVAPRPSVVVELRILVERTFDTAPIVTQPLELINTADLPGQVLRGRVLGPGAIPIQGAHVTAVNSPELVTTTDQAGGFTLTGVFSSDQVAVEVRHHHLAGRADVPLDDAEFVIDVSGSFDNARKDN